MIAEIEQWHEVGYAVGLSVAAAFSAYSAWHSKQAKSIGDQINDAVNHRHLKDKDENGNMPPKLYDAVLHLHRRSDQIDQKADELLEWKRTYDGGDLDSGEKVARFVESVTALKEHVDKLTKNCEGDGDGCDG